jgi:molybdopterin biosynthesis enzyme
VDARLSQVNELEDIVIYTLPHHHVVLEGELVARAKIVPFVTAEARVQRAEAIGRESGGLLRVNPFSPARVAALVQESLEPPQLARFRAAFEEKLRFFGSELLSVDVVPKDPERLASALRAAIARGATLVAVAGSKPMDPLDAALQGLHRAGARMEMHGVPVHPGTLLWLAYLDGAPVIGMPSCGLFSKATVFDLLLPRVLSGERLGRAQLAALGSGGLLTHDSLHRFPPYRPQGPRGQLDE